MAGRKTFTAGEVLQAADVNDFLMDQSVMVFAGTAARGSAIPSPSEGMVTYLEDADELQVYTTDWGAVSTPGILQVVSGTRKTEISTTSTTFSAITGVEATITPSSTSSKVLVLAQISASADVGSAGAFFRVRRGGTDTIFVGDTSGSRTRVTVATALGSNEQSVALPIMFLDSPSTTSPVTYDIAFASAVSGNLVIVNRRLSSSDTSFREASASSITVMEVAG